MTLSSYFWNGFQHALAGGGFALVFYKLNQTNYLKKGEYVIGLIISSSALFFLPLHIGPYWSFLDRLYQFSHYPFSDWDILLFGMEWHRCFLTHSLVLPMLLLLFWLHKPAGFRFGLGMSVGLSSHLVWDALTCSMYTPVVFFSDLLEIRGYWAKGWLMLNGFVLFGFAWYVARKMHPVKQQAAPDLEKV